MNKILMILFVGMVMSLSAEITVTRYVDDFGDKTGPQIIIISGDIISGGYSFGYNVGKFIIEADGSIEYRTSQYLTTQEGVETILIRDDKGRTLSYEVETSNIGDNKQTFDLSDYHKEVLRMLMDAAWVKVVVYDYTGDAVVSQIYLSGVTSTLSSTFGITKASLAPSYSEKYFSTILEILEDTVGDAEVDSAFESMKELSEDISACQSIAQVPKLRERINKVSSFEFKRPRALTRMEAYLKTVNTTDAAVLQSVKEQEEFLIRGNSSMDVINAKKVEFCESALMVLDGIESRLSQTAAPGAPASN